ncbi:hypothetical protein Scep_026853 [Stephania cephalantha]|uniref:Uncharacterized protein n=1 Tax=Stephania cephalantha TaxID=152367 RepID=A0AAP0HQV3_9MAGN
MWVDPIPTAEVKEICSPFVGKIAKLKENIERLESMKSQVDDNIFTLNRQIEGLWQRM